MRFVLALLVGLLVAGSAAPEEAKEMSVKDFLRNTYTDKESLIFLKGVVSGVLAANAFIEVKTRQPLFCIPEKTKINVEQARQIAENFMRDHPQFDAWTFPSLPFVVGRAFMVTFPCP
jgi:hypothetical protein